MNTGKRDLVSPAEFVNALGDINKDAAVALLMQDCHCFSSTKTKPWSRLFRLHLSASSPEFVVDPQLVHFHFLRSCASIHSFLTKTTHTPLTRAALRSIDLRQLRRGNRQETKSPTQQAQWHPKSYHSFLWLSQLPLSLDTPSSILAMSTGNRRAIFSV